MQRVSVFSVASSVGILVAAFFALSVVFPTAGLAQTTFTMGFDGDDQMIGAAADEVTKPYFCTLTQADGGNGAQGWSMSLTAENAAIVSITTAGTDVDALFSGGFNKTETTSGVGNEGAVSAIVLSFVEERNLPTDRASTLAKIDVKATIPDPAGAATLRYVDGRRGSGQPVQNAITQDGNTVRPTLGSKDIQLVPVPTCCNAKLNVGFSAANGSSSSAYDGIVDLPKDPRTCTGDGGSIEVPTPEGSVGSGHIFASISSNGADTGVQGWSFSIALNGDMDFQSPTSVTTAGTSVDSFFNGGFNKTEIIDPAKNSGQKGAVSAVVLSFTLPIVFPATGTESVLDLGVNANQAQGDADITGSLSFQDGLRGSGQPVKNAITVGGATQDACNKTFANVNVVFTKVGVSNYIRGNPNDDDRVNIADGIWIVNELFRGGAPTKCPAAADTNDDGAEDAADAVYLINYLFKGGSAPPAPFPACGGAGELADASLCPGASVDGCR